MPNLFWCAMMPEATKKDYIKDGLIYQGVPLYASPASVELPNGEFTVEVVNELIKEHTSSSSYRPMFRMFHTGDGTNQFGSLRNDGLMLYMINNNTWAITARPTGYTDIGVKRTSTFVFDENKIRSFYYNGELKAKENKATTALSRTDYNNVYVETVYYNYFDVRIYNRVLTPEEIAHNYEIDKERFLI